MFASRKMFVVCALVVVCVAVLCSSGLAATFDFTSPAYLDGATYLSNDSSVTATVSLKEDGTGGNLLAANAGTNYAHTHFYQSPTTNGHDMELTFSPPVTFDTLTIGLPNGVRGFWFSDYEIELTGGATLVSNNDGGTSGYNVVQQAGNHYTFEKTTASSVKSQFHGSFAVSGPVNSLIIRMDKVFTIAGSDGYQFAISSVTSTVPEPATAALASLLMAGTVGMLRRRW